jgi:hypothetical protein
VIRPGPRGRVNEPVGRELAKDWSTWWLIVMLPAMLPPWQTLVTVDVGIENLRLPPVERADHVHFLLA